MSDDDTIEIEEVSRCFNTDPGAISVEVKTPD